MIFSVPLNGSGSGSFGDSNIKSHVVYGQDLVSMCDLSLEMEGMWEEGSSSNKAVEIGDARYTTVTGHLQAGMLVCQGADNSPVSSGDAVICIFTYSF